jgi:hypothetical protein
MAPGRGPVLLLLLLGLQPGLGGDPAERSMDPGLQEEYCRNFTVGDPDHHVFFSPRHPQIYPAGIKCFRTITADYGYFVRIDFRDEFRIEPASNEGNCDYDYLEVTALHSCSCTAHWLRARKTRSLRPSG